MARAGTVVRLKRLDGDLMAKNGVPQEGHASTTER